MDAVKQDRPDHLPKLVESMADVVEDELAAWINDNGGWVCTELKALHSLDDFDHCILGTSPSERVISLCLSIEYYNSIVFTKTKIR